MNTAAKKQKPNQRNELLEALKAAEQYMTDCGYFAASDETRALASQMRAAIAKARRGTA